MSKTDRGQQILGWLNSEKKKDLKELEVNKEKIIKELINRIIKLENK